jgi:PAS domain S-box-containing protein
MNFFLSNQSTLRQRLKTLFGVLVFLLTLNLFLVNYAENLLQEDNALAEVARRNTNHIYRSVNFARNIIEGKRSNVNDLAKEMKLTDANFELLLKGGEYYDRNYGEVQLPSLSEEYASQYSEVSRLWGEMRKKLRTIIENNARLDSTFNYYQKVGFLSAEEQEIYQANRFQEKDDIFELDKGSDKKDEALGLDAADSLSLDDFFNDPEPENGDLFSNSRRLNNTLNDGSDGYISISRTFKIVNPLVLPAYEYVVNNSEKLLLFNQNLTNVFVVQFINHQSRLSVLMVLMWILNIGFVIYAYFYITNNTLSPVEYITREILQIAQGNVKKSALPVSDSEIGNLVQSVNKLSISLDKITDFATKVGSGAFDSDFEVRSEKDLLGFSLISMSENLRKNAEDAVIRNWTNEGMAKFGDILRVSHRQIDELSYQIISNLVQYLKANQGGLFILNDDDPNNRRIRLAASYAYNKRKYTERELLYGQGLVGQAILEEGTIYTDKIPNGYVFVTSGLGEATPNALLIVPLKLSQKVYGAIEIATFGKFEPYQIAFVEKLSESIAATIATVKANEKTVKLLEETQFFSEQMRAQEEEMRQNMEELTATQEEMERSQRTLQVQVGTFRETIDSAKSWIVNLDKDFKIKAINKAYADYIRKSFGNEPKEGTNFFGFFPPELQTEWTGYYNRALNGEHVTLVKNIKDADKEDIYFMIDIDPIFDKRGAVKSLVVFVRDITSLHPIRWES